jgi:hypothetical protein
LRSAGDAYPVHCKIRYFLCGVLRPACDTVLCVDHRIGCGCLCHAIIHLAARWLSNVASRALNISLTCVAGTDGPNAVLAYPEFTL